MTWLSSGLIPNPFPCPVPLLTIAAQHGLACAHREWSGAQDEMRKKLLGQMAQSLRDNAEAGAAPPGPDDWMEDEELVEAELLCLLATGEGAVGGGGAALPAGNR